VYLHDLLAGMRRRWYLVFFGLLLSAALSWYVFTIVPVSYTARSSVLLLPPQSVTPTGQNPYLNLTGMAPAMDVLTRRVDADAIRTPVEEKYPDAEYTVFADTSTSGPMVVTEVTANTPRTVLTVLDAIDGKLVSSFDSMQADLGVPPVARMTLTTVSVDATATQVSTRRTQFVVAAGVIAFGATVLLTGMIDGLIMARRKRRSDARARAMEDEEDETEDPAERHGPEESEEVRSERERREVSVESVGAEQAHETELAEEPYVSVPPQH
jgi:hypothetical protein